MSPWRIPAIMSIGLVSPSGVSTVDDVLVYSTLIASIIGWGIPYRAKISNVFAQSIESNALPVFLQ